MARTSKEEVKTTGWNLTDLVRYKFLKAGAPYGYAYFANDIAELSLTKAEYDKLTDNGVITKV